MSLLEQQIAEKRKHIASDDYPMSIGELANLYRDGDLIIDPKFQRFFRWDDEYKTRFIESIFLNLPIPSFFVATNQNGDWEVVDGLQRLSTIFQFMNVLNKDNQASKDWQNTLVLRQGKYLTELEGKKWDDLPEVLKKEFKRSKLQIFILKKGSYQESKFDLFDRLNTASLSLSDQELRNCKLIETNESFYDRFEALTKSDDVVQFFNFLSEEDKERREDQDYFARWLTLVFTNEDELDLFKKKKCTFKEMVDVVLLRLAKDESQWDIIENCTRNTFGNLNTLGPEDSILTHPKKKGSVSFPRFIVFTIGLGIKYKFSPSATALSREELEKIRQTYWDECDKEGSEAKKELSRGSTERILASRKRSMALFGVE
jgi:uncharacterized protein with ParB-like and HNH nuclease domain